MELIRKYLFPVTLGLLLTGGLAYAGAFASASSDEVMLAQAEEDGAGGEDEMRRHRGPGRHGPRGFLHHAVRSEAVVETDDGFRTIRTDRGVLTAIEDRTLVLEEADGEVVRIPVSDDTEIKRDGEEAELGDLQERDHVFAHRIDDGDGFATEHIFALSPEGYEEREAERGERAERFEERRRLFGPDRADDDAEDAVA